MSFPGGHFVCRFCRLGSSSNRFQSCAHDLDPCSGLCLRGASTPVAPSPCCAPPVVSYGNACCAPAPAATTSLYAPAPVVQRSTSYYAPEDRLLCAPDSLLRTDNNLLRAGGNELCSADRFLPSASDHGLPSIGHLHDDSNDVLRVPCGANYVVLCACSDSDTCLFSSVDIWQ